MCRVMKQKYFPKGSLFQASIPSHMHHGCEEAGALQGTYFKRDAYGE